MENTTRSKKVVNGLVYVVILVLIGVIVYQQHQIKILSQSLNSGDESIGKLVSDQDDITQKHATRVTTHVAKGNGQGEYDDMRYQLEAAEEELDMAHEQLADELARKGEASNSMTMGPQSPMAMLQTPEGKKRLRNALKNGFDHKYNPLFKGLNLSPEKIDQLKELLADQSISSMEINNELRNGPPSEEDRNKIHERLEDLKNQNDAALEDLLGSEDFQTFKDYDDRSRERSMIQMLSQRLGFDDTLTGDQKTSLLESLYNKRKDTYSQQGFDDDKVNFAFDMNDEGVPKMMEVDFLVYDGYINGVEEAGLSESQEKQVKGFLEEQQAMMKSMVERQARINSGETDPDGPDQDDGSGMILIMN